MTKLPEQLMHHLDQIGDETLRNAILQEVSQLNRRFGLVFERHMPEGIRLPGHPIKRGTKVCITHRKGKAVKDPVYYTVVGKPDRAAGTALIQGPDGAPFEHPLAELIAGKEFGDISYPGLKVLKEIRRDDRPNAPTHTIINGENHHVLEALQWTHAGKVDCIFIDPPYNTGKSDWKYNDHFVDGNDGYRHSKWLSFMEKRLELAKNLLTPQGMLYISIDDNEQHRLRLLMDQIFGENSFHAVLTWKKRHVPINVGSAKHKIQPKLEYVLAYSNCKRDEHPGFDTSGGTENRYPHKDDNGEYRLLNVTKSNHGHDKRDTLVYPILGVGPGSGRRWKFGEETANAMIKAGSLRMIGDTPKRVIYKDEESSSGVRTFWSHLDEHVGTASDGKKHLSSALGDEHGFDTVKPVSLVSELIARELHKNGIVLDFFGGSGTTAESVMRLNAEDGGTRQCILVTNNELAKADDSKLRKAGYQPGDAEYEALGVFHHVTKPRLETVATGIREDGSKYSDGLEANLAFLELKHLEESDIHRGAAINDLAGLFWLKAGGRGSIPAPGPDDYARGFSLAGGVAILLNTGSARALKEAVTTSGALLRALFIVTDSDAQGDEAAALFEGGPVIERIYGPYLEAFQVNRQG